MSKKLLVICSAILLLAACTKQQQQAVTDAAGQSSVAERHTQAQETPAQVSAEMDAWSKQQQATQPTSESAAIDGADASSASQATKPFMQGKYVSYTSADLTNGQTKVLFFHATWCPVCKAQDAQLKQWYGAGGIPLSVYKVDYDAEVALKQKYGVTYQHTFVKVDGEGNMIEKIQGPSAEQLKKMIGVS